MTQSSAGSADPLREALADITGAMRFVLAFYEPGQKYLDTNAWKQAEASARAAFEKAEAVLATHAVAATPSMRDALTIILAHPVDMDERPIRGDVSNEKCFWLRVSGKDYTAAKDALTGTLAQAPAVTPLLDATRKLLIAASLGSCTCNTKSPELIWHAPNCRYVTLMMALENVEAALAHPSTPSESGK